MSKYAVLRITLNKNGREYAPHVVKSVHEKYLDADNARLQSAWKTDTDWYETVWHIDDVRVLQKRGAPVIWEAQP